MASLMLKLPYPPSVNRVWRTVAGQVRLSQAARRYRKAVGDLVLEQAVARFTLRGKLSLTLLVHPPDHRTRDLGNLDKAVSDALQASGVIENDGDIDELHIVRQKVSPGGFLTVQIQELESTS